MNKEKLVYMINQIANYFISYSEEKAIDSTINHIDQFWDKRMKKEIIDHANNKGEGLNTIALKAVQRLVI